MTYVLKFELPFNTEWCATCLIIQKSSWLERNKDIVAKGRSELCVIICELDTSLPCEPAVCVGPSTILAGPNSVCMTHLLNNNPNMPTGKTLQLGSAGDMRIRHGRSD